MNRYVYPALTVFLTACGTAPENNIETEAQVSKIDTPTSWQTALEPEPVVEMDTVNYDYATFFVVVADTNADYSILHQKMFDLNRQLNIPIDTMGRFYNSSKDLIALPDDDEDEMYAGDYFPRRFPSENLSLEYLSSYQDEAGEKTIALVTGIYEMENNADSALAVLQNADNKVFKIKSEIYLGCMH